MAPHAPPPKTLQNQIFLEAYMVYFNIPTSPPKNFMVFSLVLTIFKMADAKNGLLMKNPKSYPQISQHPYIVLISCRIMLLNMLNTFKSK